MWEVSIKHNLNKLPLSGTEFMHYCEQAGFKKLEIDDRHIVALETLEVKKIGTMGGNHHADLEFSWRPCSVLRPPTRLSVEALTFRR